MGVEQNIIDRIGQFSPEKRSQSESTLVALEDRLRVLFPGLSTRQRLAEWINGQETDQNFQPLGHKATAFKRAYVSQELPELVVKHFYSSFGSNESWQQEAKDEQRARMALGDEFFPETQYVSIPKSTFADSQTGETQYFVLQDRVHGVQLKDFTSRVLDLLYTEMSDEEVDEYFADNPQQWSVLKGKALERFLPDDIWEQARQQAEKLARKLAFLEKKYILTDLDFFITPEGDIKIIDLQLVKSEDFEANEDGFPEGAEDLRLMFGLS